MRRLGISLVLISCSTGTSDTPTTTSSEAGTPTPSPPAAATPTSMDAAGADAHLRGRRVAMAFPDNCSFQAQQKSMRIAGKTQTVDVLTCRRSETEIRIHTWKTAPGDALTQEDIVGSFLPSDLSLDLLPVPGRRAKHARGTGLNLGAPEAYDVALAYDAEGGALAIAQGRLAPPESGDGPPETFANAMYVNTFRMGPPDDSVPHPTGDPLDAGALDRIFAEVGNGDNAPKFSEETMGPQPRRLSASWLQTNQHGFDVPFLVSAAACPTAEVCADEYHRAIANFAQGKFALQPDPDAPPQTWWFVYGDEQGAAVLLRGATLFSLTGIGTLHLDVIKRAVHAIDRGFAAATG